MRTFHTVPFQWPKAALAELDKSSERIRRVARFKDLFRDLNLRIVTSQSQLEGKKKGACHKHTGSMRVKSAIKKIKQTSPVWKTGQQQCFVCVYVYNVGS